MVKDVVEVNARNTDIQTVEVNSLQCFGIDIRSQIHLAYLIVVNGTSVEYIKCKARTIHTSVYLQFTFSAKQVEVSQVDGVSEEKPAPSEIQIDCPVDPGVLSL